MPQSASSSDTDCEGGALARRQSSLSPVPGERVRHPACGQRVKRDANSLSAPLAAFFTKIRSTIIKASTKLQRGFMRGRVAAHTLPAVFQKPNWENRNEHYVQI